MNKYKNKLTKHFLFCKKLLKLPSTWKFKITIDNTISEYANVQWNYPSKIFQIVINETRNQDETILIDTITHELLHVLLSPTTCKIERLIQKLQNKEKISFTNTQKQFNRLEENLVRHLTKVILQSVKGSK